MKKLYTFLMIALFAIAGWSQAPGKLSYQAVIRNSSGDLVVNSVIGIQISILQGTSSGSAVYTEVQMSVSNEIGLISMEIGGNSDFESIDWSHGPYYLKTEVDPEGGTSYSITGVSQLLSVPYALHARMADSISGSFSESHNLSDVLSNGNDGGSMQIKNLADPTEAMDSVTKAYVDSLLLLAINSFASPEETFTSVSAGTVKDADGNTYNTIKIGSQWWMAENLRTTKYCDGTDINYQPNADHWYLYSSPAYCWYNNDETNKIPYGALYNYYVVETNKICPAGWRVPGHLDWEVLANYLGGADVAGGKLKESGTEHWQTPNAGATNETGFTAVGNGYRGEDGIVEGVDASYHSLKGTANFWAAWDPELPLPDLVRFFYNNATIYWFGTEEKPGAAIRCIRGEGCSGN
jgi:uncharacterized protein (TIGR02145 family)